ncbi:hypothetical protein MXD63_34475 [Frankia sp. Cpl3]|nr:hypothetical protein [Frankia sp. Cpl3]
MTATQPTATTGTPRIGLYDGHRSDLRVLFELAEDSATQLDAYLDLGRVLVARLGPRIVGHLQVVATGYPSGLVIDGIALRDRVWLDLDLDLDLDLALLAGRPPSPAPAPGGPGDGASDHDRFGR